MLRVSILILCLAAVFVAARCPNHCSDHGSCIRHHCVCDSGYAGVDCSVPDAEIRPGTVNGTVAIRKWMYYHYDLLNEGEEFRLAMHETNGGVVHDCDLYVRQDNFPTKRHYYAKDTHGVGADAFINVTADAPRGTWFIGVYGFLGCDFQLSLSTPATACPEGCSSHGTCLDGGVCACQPGWGDEDCSAKNISLAANTEVSGAVERREWNYFYFDLTETREMLEFVMDAEHDADLYVNKDVFPSLFRFFAVNASTPLPGHRDYSTLRVEQPDLGRWYVGIYGFEASSFNVKVVTEQLEGSTCANNCSTHGSCSDGRCECSHNFVGDVCEYYQPDLTMLQSVRGYVDAGQWNYFTVSPNTLDNLIVSAQQDANITPDGDCDLYVRRGAYPNRTSFDYADLGFGASMRVLVPEPGRSQYYIGVYGWTKCAFSLTVKTETVAQDCGPHGQAHEDDDTCTCEAGWYGEECTDQAQVLTSNAPVVAASVATGEWKYFSLSANATSYVFVIEETSGSGGNTWCYLNVNDVPAETDFLESDTQRGSVHSLHHVTDFYDTRTVIVGVLGSPFGGEGLATSFKISGFAF